MLARGKAYRSSWLPATTGLGEADLTTDRSAWAALTKFSLKTIGPTASIGPTWPSMAFTPLIDNWMAPTWEKLAPMPPPTAKLEKATNWLSLLFSEPSVVLVMGTLAQDQSLASL